MVYKPLLFEFRGNTMLKAFIIYSILAGITSALTIEFRNIVDIRLPDEHAKDFQFHNIKKLIYTAILSSITTFILFLLLRLFWGFGEGFLANKPKYKYFL